MLDANVENLDHDETMERIKAENPKLVGIVNYGQQANTAAPLMTETRNLIHKIKDKDPGRRIVLTGWNPSAVPGRTLREEACDYVGEGEAFYTYLRLVEGRKLEEVPGLMVAGKRGDPAYAARPEHSGPDG